MAGFIDETGLLQDGDQPIQISMYIRDRNDPVGVGHLRETGG
jgi:hypothetical protein